MSDDDLLTCECGCTHWIVARDGLIECVDCGSPTADRMALPADVMDNLRARGLIEPEAVH